jgi:hypothetical protein
MIEAKNSISSTDQTSDEKNLDTVEALKQQIHNLKKK